MQTVVKVAYILLVWCQGDGFGLVHHRSVSSAEQGVCSSQVICLWEGGARVAVVVCFNMV